MRFNYAKSLLILLPDILFWYLGLFLTIWLWYPAGLTSGEWRAHVVNFSIVYALWFIIFFTYSLFDLQVLHNARTMMARLFGATMLCIVIAIVYFYFQPQLLITPRRFLLVHAVISSTGIFIWYWFLHEISPKIWLSVIYYHSSFPDSLSLEQLINEHGYRGLKYSGLYGVTNTTNTNNQELIIVLPDHRSLDEKSEQDIFALRRVGVKFINFHDLYENLTRTVHLAVLTDLWFIHSVDYSVHRISDTVKRAMDIMISLIGLFVFIVTFPLIAILIKISSKGPVFFIQPRVGQLGKVFMVYKYRTMKTSTESNTWTSPNDSRITLVGKFLRATRLDELPQSINIFKGDMSIVGPRPEQVNIVQQMREQIPYYDERHIVKPGLTGWAQLHVYAATVEETRRKLQYDLYYIKHRNLLFDFEIIMKTTYNILTFKGR